MNAINSNIISGSKDIYTSADKHDTSDNVIARYNIEETTTEAGAATLSLSKEGIRRAGERKENAFTPEQIQEYRNVANQLAMQSKDPSLTQIQRNDINDNLNKVHLQLSDAADRYISPDNFTVII